MAISKSLKQQIIDFKDKGDHFFINWLNGTVDKSSKSVLNQLLHDVKIMYSGEHPSLIDKEQLLGLDSVYGRSVE